MGYQYGYNTPQNTGFTGSSSWQMPNLTSMQQPEGEGYWESSSPFGGPGSRTWVSGPKPLTMEGIATAPYTNSQLQAGLPPWLRHTETGPMLDAGMQQIAELLSNPGGVSSRLQENIAERLGSERANISQNYAGLASEQAGAAARGNMPVSIRYALARALGTNERRAQGDATRGAISESEDLRRADTGETYKLLDTILQYMSSWRGSGIQGLQAAQGIDNTNNASNMAMIAALAQGIGAAAGGKG